MLTTGPRKVVTRESTIIESRMTSEIKPISWPATAADRVAENWGIEIIQRGGLADEPETARSQKQADQDVKGKNGQF